MSLLPISTNTTFKHTRSRCPVCLDEIDAEMVRTDTGVFMLKECPTHGGFRVRLQSHPEHYHLSTGNPDNASCCGPSCGCGPVNTESTDPIESLSTCIALIEIVDSCNIACPTCYAGSPVGTGSDLSYTPAEQVFERIQAVIDRKGLIDILQLSGGEPTIHPEFMRILEWAVRNEQIGYVLVNTNGIRLDTDDALRKQMGQLRREHLGFELYLQYDGPQEQGQLDLRGADLRSLRNRVIAQCAEEGIPTTLAMVVTPDTMPHMGDAIRIGLAEPMCRGITLQPMFSSGRVPTESSTLPVLREHECAAIGSGDIIEALAAQSQGLLDTSDFTPLPCGDPNCHTISYIIRKDDGPVALGKLMDLNSLQGFLSDRVDYRLEDLTQCGCESEPLGDILAQLEIGPDAPFRIFIKPFMDAWTFDQDRIDRCCTHVIKPDGSLDSFCRHYLSTATA